MKSCLMQDSSQFYHSKKSFFYSCFAKNIFYYEHVLNGIIFAFLKIT